MDELTAVVTTGIYCRPGCPGRPSPENVRTFGVAAAAEASGYRACLRCRPYRSPSSFADVDSELVCRAVQLVLHGLLDEGTETDLGARLGVSPRHLRRLFTAQLGVTPDQLARSRRAHFARRLLDDTDLTITDIAFASGYGSVRQLNRACHEIFQASPRQLRDRRRRSDRLVADGGLLLRLPFRGLLNWDAMLAYFAARAIPGVEHVVGNTYRRTIVIDGDPGVLEVWPDGADQLLLRAHLPHWERLIHIVERARRMFSLDQSPEEANKHLADDPVVGDLVKARPGLRVPGTWDPFETGVRAIIGQQVSVAGATTVVARLVRKFGEPVAGLQPFALTHTFPPPEVVARADLTGIGLTRARADAVVAFAEAVETGSVRLDGSVELDRFVSSVTAIRGLGPWTAQYMALRLGERDALPVDDLGLRRSLARIAPTSGATLANVATSWSPWRALAATHLWASPSGGAGPPLPRSVEPTE